MLRLNRCSSEPWEAWGPEVQVANPAADMTDRCCRRTELSKRPIRPRSSPLCLPTGVPPPPPSPPCCLLQVTLVRRRRRRQPGSAPAVLWLQASVSVRRSLCCVAPAAPPGPGRPDKQRALGAAGSCWGLLGSAGSCRELLLIRAACAPFICRRFDMTESPGSAPEVTRSVERQRAWGLTCRSVWVAANASLPSGDESLFELLQIIWFLPG